MNNCVRLWICCVLLLTSSLSFGANLDKPIVSEDVVFEEVNGMVAVEAEHFYKQTLTAVRRWYRTSAKEWPKPGRDTDGPHVVGASNNAYLEILPDTRKDHNEPLIHGINFSNEPGKLGVLHYKVYFNTPGRYYVWVRTYSTGSEDNGLHVGIDGTWPEHGQRMQWTAKRQWFWDCKQRTSEEHTGVPLEIYLDIKEPGLHEIQFSMREDGFEFDKWLMTTDRDYRPSKDEGPAVRVKAGTLPPPFPRVEKGPEIIPPEQVPFMKAVDFPIDGTQFYNDDNMWLAINPEVHRKAKTSKAFPFKSGRYDVVLLAVGEDDGKSEYRVWVNDTEIGHFVCPLGPGRAEEGPQYNELWENIQIQEGDTIIVESEVGSEDGFDHSRGRWAGLFFAPIGSGKALLTKASTQTEAYKAAVAPKQPELYFSDPMDRKPDGKGKVHIGGELKQWHKVTLTLDGPFAHELDKHPNPFTDYNMTVKFKHESGKPVYNVPGYFAADGNAGQTSADSGTSWSAHLAPDKPGKWTYEISFVKGNNVAMTESVKGKKARPWHGKNGRFTVEPTDKTGRDLRGKGRLEYVGKHHLRFAETGEYFLKCGADAPENFLAYQDFDGDFKTDGHKDNFIKDWGPHIKDWRQGDPTWQGGKGKGIIGAVNYLASQGMNVFSFLTMNIKGDDQNVFPYTTYDERLQIDVSRLAQWEILFEHDDKLGMYLHFKTMETENELLLDKGDLGVERKLYYRELIARFSHHLALNWNLGEEINDATTEQKVAWANYFWMQDPYQHHIVIHNMGDPHYDLLGEASKLTGFSLQTSRPDFSQVHSRTRNYIDRSVAAGKPWVVACDEPGDATHALITDDEDPTRDNARKNGLWGNIMAGGAGIEWYFGYKHPHSDLTCQDYRTREKMWNQCALALEFFKKYEIPFWDMKCDDNLTANTDDYCFYKTGRTYLVYLKHGGKLQLNVAAGNFTYGWFNPRNGDGLEALLNAGKIKGPNKLNVSAPDENDWVLLMSSFNQGL